eukprot:scaffold67009_cov42-Attheya_sp.AAC.3
MGFWGVSAAVSLLLVQVLSTVLNTDAFGTRPVWSSTVVRQRRRTAIMRMSSSSKLSFEDVEGVIFDIDGTLADSWKLGYDATVVVLDQNDLPPINEQIYHDHTRYATPERLARHAGITPDHADFDEVGTRLGAEFDNLYVGLVDRQTAGFYPGVEELLMRIPPHVQVGALTNACVAYAHAVLTTNCPLLSSTNESTPTSSTSSTTTVTRRVGIYERFGSIRGADNVPQPKPAPDGLYVCCADMGVDPKKCIYIGDSPSDAGAAQNAGMPSIGVLWGSHPEESLQKASFAILCQTMDELQSLLPQTNNQ